MTELKELTAEKLLDKCPEEITWGNWDDAWQEVRRRVKRLEKCEAALRRLTTEHISYDDPSVGTGSYGIGVVDGHRCGANVARAALKEKR